MSIYNPDKTMHAGEDLPFSANFDPCVDSTPDLTGMTFSFTAVPTSGANPTITKTCSVSGTTISWTLAAADTSGVAGTDYTCELRRTNTGSVRVWAIFNLSVVA